jgi:hypothetical protein
MNLRQFIVSYTAVLGSNLSLKNEYYSRAFYGFTQALQINVRIVFQIRPRLLPYRFFFYSLFSNRTIIWHHKILSLLTIHHIKDGDIWVFYNLAVEENEASTRLFIMF